MHVLVTGGSGFVGREIVRQLLAAGHRVRVLSRGKRVPVPGTAEVRGSVLEPASLPAAFAGCDAVVHLVGIISEVGDQTFERVHTTGTVHALAAAREAGISRFLHMSALGTRPDAVSRYHQSKWAAEEAVRRSDRTWTIFRPGLIYGPGDGFVTMFARMARYSPALPVMGAGGHLLQPVAVADVARAFVSALTEPASHGQTFDVCGRERLTLAAILRAIGEATGRRRMQLHIPLPLARLQASVLETVFPQLLGQAPPLNRDQLLMLQEDNVGDPEPARRLFQLELEPFAEGIRRFLAPTGPTPAAA